MRQTLFIRTGLKFLYGLVVSSILAGTVSARADSFSSDQKTEIGEIIRHYLLENPEVLRDAFVELERRNAATTEKTAREGISNNAETLYKSKLSYTAGNENGDITMVEFFDYNCGYCKRAFGDVEVLLKTDSELKLIAKEFPILGPNSLFASRAAIASKSQGKYWEFHVAMMEASGALNEEKVMRIAAQVGLDTKKLHMDMETPEVTAEIEENYALATKLGINGTPAFIIDDKLFPGAMGLPALRQQLASVRDSGGCKIC